jgi:hypothetical protein
MSSVFQQQLRCFGPGPWFSRTPVDIGTPAHNSVRYLPLVHTFRCPLRSVPPSVSVSIGVSVSVSVGVSQKIGQTHSELVVDLKGLLRYSRPPSFAWSGLAPDGSSLLVRNLSTDEIYALDLDLP